MNYSNLSSENYTFKGNKLTLLNTENEILGYIKYRNPIELNGKKFVTIEKVEVLKKDAGLGTKLYSMLLNLIPFDGIAGYIPDIVNPRVHSIYSRLGAKKIGKYYILDKKVLSLKEFLLDEGINDKGIFKAIFLAGIPGAGKSTIQKELNNGVYPRIVNTDKFSRDFFGVYKGLYDIYGATPRDIVDRSKSLAKTQLFSYLDGMLPLIIDSTSSSSSNLLKRKGILESLGYDVGLVFISTSKEKAKERNKSRIGKGDGGVPDEFIDSVFDKLEEIKDFYANGFPFYREISNDFDNALDINFMDIYKKVQNFYNSNVKNPIGKRIIKELQENNKKLLTDYKGQSEQKLNSLVSSWY